MSIEALSALPAWSQSAITCADGDRDPQWFNDCGEICVAAVVSAVHGTPVSAASVRANLGGPARSGLTTGADLVKALAFYHVTAEDARPRADELQGYLAHITRLKQPTIVLGEWPTPGGAWHWMLTTKAAERWDYINPWSGNRSWLAWSDVLRFYRHSVVWVGAHLHYDMSTTPQPY